MTRDEQQEADSRKAWDLGVKYGKEHSFAEIAPKNLTDCAEMSRDATAMGCPSMFFDVFKYGAQSVWRASGQLKEDRR